MPSRRIPAAFSMKWILLLGTVLMAAAVFFGVPAEFRLDPTRIKVELENAYLAPLPKLPWPLVVAKDGPETPRASRTRLFEDGRPLGPAHTVHASIRSAGRGRYSHWQEHLYFSSSDNSDPRKNGRRYVAAVRVRLSPQILLVGLFGLGVAGAAAFVRWFRKGQIDLSDFLFPFGLWAGTALSFGAASRARGIVLWLAIGLGAVSLIWAAATSRHAVAKGTGRTWRGWGFAHNASLLVASLTIASSGAEATLMILERRAMELEPIIERIGRRTIRPGDESASAGRGEGSAAASDIDTLTIAARLRSFGVEVPGEVLRTAARRSALITLPPELDRAPVEVEGAKSAVTWHGVLHVKDRNNMRRATPFPVRQKHVLRIMVVGDSFTYGYGVDERWTYARQLEALLEPDYNIEVLNLGVFGHQSEDVLSTVREFLPHLRPNLMVYGVCLNDFLPSGTHRYQNAYTIPLPESAKTFFIRNSRIARLGEDAYKRAQIYMGLRADFFDDILDGFNGYQQRFARDVVRMNELVTARGLPPTVALVLDHTPAVSSRGHRIAQAAERHLKNGGMDVIGMDRYYCHFDGEILRVSRWERHPNEAANAIWAVMLARHLRNLPGLRPFRKASTEVTPD